MELMEDNIVYLVFYGMWYIVDIIDLFGSLYRMEFIDCIIGSYEYLKEWIDNK